MQRLVFGLFFLCLFFICSFSDVYMHNPRGSNDRNCERSENRRNGNRLFDSQNNAKGGYACPRAVGGPEVETPRFYYHSGSIVTIEWTAQHGCGADNDEVDCDLVIQYMCEEDSPGLRDGTPSDQNDDATDTIPAKGSTDPRFGQHETANWYQDCMYRERNKGLYTADQNLNGNGAIYTRQNPNGQRSGLECPEERDYYPYWHPTPWTDIAILTHDTDRCEYYEKHSQNVEAKGECVPREGQKKPTTNGGWPNNENACNATGGIWRKNETLTNGNPPECLGADWTRVNHLGNSFTGGYMVNYNWTIPMDLESNACVVRIRYNISTDDFQQHDGLKDKTFVDAKLNGLKSPLPQDPYYLLTFGDDDVPRYLSLAVDTDQFGRTFQDRSYAFAVKKRDDDIPDSAKIYNLNVRGKRGNIVQTFPAVEYDFVPTRLHLEKGDYVHFQWTGSDYNPPRNPNDAEGGPRPPTGGDPGADRSNIVELSFFNLNEPANKSDLADKTMFVDDDGDADFETALHLAYLNQTDCKTIEQLLQIQNENDRDFDSQNCFKINTPTPYFNGGVVKMNKEGTFKYMSSRNNHFTNRDQKGSIMVGGNKGFTVGWAIFLTTVVLASVLIVAAIAYIVYNNAQKKSRANVISSPELNERLIS